MQDDTHATPHARTRRDRSLKRRTPSLLIHWVRTRSALNKAGESLEDQVIPVWARQQCHCPVFSPAYYFSPSDAVESQLLGGLHNLSLE